MASEKESFIFYRSFFEALQDLEDSERLKVYDAICDLALNEKDTKFTGISKTVFTLIRPQILSNTKKYKDGQKGGQYGKLGGRPKEEKTPLGLLEKTPLGLLEKTPNVNDNVNVNVNDNVTTNVVNNASDSCVDGLQDVVEFYQNNIGMLSPFGLEVLQTYVQEMNKDIVIYAMQISVEANKRTIQYIKAILNNWQKAEIKTLAEAKEESQKKKNNKVGQTKSNTYNNYEQRGYEDLSFLYANIPKEGGNTNVKDKTTEF